MKILAIMIFLFLFAKVKNIAINRVTIITIVAITAAILIIAYAIYQPLFWFLIK